MSDKDKKQVEADVAKMAKVAEKMAERQMAKIGIRPIDLERNISISWRVLKLLLINTYLKGSIDKAEEIKHEL